MSDQPGGDVPARRPSDGSIVGRDLGLSAVSGAAPAPERRGMFGVTGSGDTSGYSRLMAVRPQRQTATRPYGGWFDDAVDALESGLGGDDAIEAVVVERGELTLHVKRERLVEVAAQLRDNPALRCELLSNLSGVDYLGGDDRRLHVVCELTSMTFARTVRLEVSVTEEDPHVPSLTGVYPTADFQERECWDFFGVVFDGHPALTRIEMPDDWVGHPQRKDYPLGGVQVEYKGAQVPPPDARRTYA